MIRRPDPDSIRWAIAAAVSPELVALILSVIVLVAAVLLLRQT
jgi:hypothetical protein